MADHSADTTKLLGDSGPSAISVLVICGGVVRVYPLPPGGALRIGRNPAADIVLDETSLSRDHAVIRNHAGVIDVEDLASSNGTRVRGKPLVARSPTRIEVGDAINFGAVYAVIQETRGELAERLRPAASAGTDELIDRIADSAVSVLILGETGVGKEVMAERLHARSSRRDGPLIKLNCAALSGSLLESELFGHERGAFTGAVKDKPGLVESADGGTLFLDEIGEIELAVQVKLLRVLEMRETQRIGAVRPRKVDVRFLAATNRTPAVEIAAGRMRSDLYYRIAGFTLTIPPLRDRRDEIPVLAPRLLAAACAHDGRAVAVLTPAATAELARHAWPGNVRELRNVIDRALILTRGSSIDAHEIRLAISYGAELAPARPAAPPTSPDDAERARVLAALEQAGGNQTIAAERLGISRRSLVYRLQAWGMTRPRRR